jgi:hypothetical protein
MDVPAAISQFALEPTRYPLLLMQSQLAERHTMERGARAGMPADDGRGSLAVN